MPPCVCVCVCMYVCEKCDACCARFEEVDASVCVCICMYGNEQKYVVDVEKCDVCVYVCMYVCMLSSVMRAARALRK
jgi:hypothetical protein